MGALKKAFKGASGKANKTTNYQQRTTRRREKRSEKKTNRKQARADRKAEKKDQKNERKLSRIEKRNEGREQRAEKRAAIWGDVKSGLGNIAGSILNRSGGSSGSSGGGYSGPSPVVTDGNGGAKDLETGEQISDNENLELSEHQAEVNTEFGGKEVGVSRKAEHDAALQDQPTKPSVIERVFGWQP